MAKVAATTAPRKITSALASLNRLSPSRIDTSRRGGLMWRSTADAATASGGATMAPSAMAGAQASPGVSQRDNGDRDGGGDDGAEHEAGDRDPVALQLADRHVETGVDQNGREKQGEGEIGRELDARKARQEGDAGADQREKVG